MKHISFYPCIPDNQSDIYIFEKSVEKNIPNVSFLRYEDQAKYKTAQGNSVQRMAYLDGIFFLYAHRYNLIVASNDNDHGLGYKELDTLDGSSVLLFTGNSITPK